MNLGNMVAVISDVHGERSMLRAALARSRSVGADSIVLLGDLFDRVDQAGQCAACLCGWTVAGVLGNHEREALASGGSDRQLDDGIQRLLSSLSDRLQIEDAVFVHDGLAWPESNEHYHSDSGSDTARLTFAGHTHFRQARDENGPLDLSLGRIHLRPDRRYLINPGAAVNGLFAIWDRKQSKILFERISGDEGG